MPELLKSDAIQKAYLDPVRTVILVDDGFPPYNSFASMSPMSAGVATLGFAPPVALAVADVETGTARQEPGAGNAITEETTPAAAPETPAAPNMAAPGRAGKEYDRARALWTVCRNRGYLCDIDDGGELEHAVPAHISKSDLVILDYHLQGEDPALALKLLKHLAVSDHARLVVVYTADKNLVEVRRRVVAHLRGARAIRTFLTPEESSRWEDLDWHPELSKDTLDSFLTGDRKWSGDTDLRAELKRRGISPGESGRMIEAALESFLIDAFAVGPVDPSDLHHVNMSGAGSPRLWVHTENLFIALLSKTEENALDGAEVFLALTEALEDWNPPYLPMVLAFARGAVARGGFRRESIALSDPLLQAGWLYHAVAGEDTERTDRLRGLFERLLSRHSEALLTEIADFGKACFPELHGAADKLGWARAEVPACLKSEGWHVVHRLNEFLATQSPGNFVETGTLFVPTVQEDYLRFAWICVTPACDLVPRPPRGDTWEHRLHPIRPMLALRGQLINCGIDALKIAERFQHVFLTTSDGLKAVQLVNEKDPNARLEMFLLDDMGRILDGTFKATRLSRSDDGVLTSSVVSFRAVARLRGLYASRLLQLAGNHLSRIGPDFVNLPD
jgi:Response receiver domain